MAVTHISYVYGDWHVLSFYVCGCGGCVGDGAFDCDRNLCICVVPGVLENWPNISEDVRRLLSTAGTWRES